MRVESWLRTSLQHLWIKKKNPRLVSSEPTSAPHCRFSPNTSFTFERSTKCLLWRLVPSPHSWPRSEPSRAQPSPPLLTRTLESKVSTYRGRGQSNSLPLCARCEACSTASWESPVSGGAAGEGSQCMGFLTVLEKNNGAFPFHSFSEKKRGVGLCSGKRLPHFPSEAQGRALLAG